jgi:hypothetical protein
VRDTTGIGFTRLASQKNPENNCGFLLTVSGGITQNTASDAATAGRNASQSLTKTNFESSSDPFDRVPGGSGVWCVSGRSWQGAISMAKKKKKAAKKVAKKKKGHG